MEKAIIYPTPLLRRRCHRHHFGRRVRLKGRNPAGVLAVLKNEKFKNLDKKKEIEKLLNSISNQLFDQLVSIGRLITDYQDGGDAAAPAPTDGNEEALNDDIGVAVEFEEDERIEEMDMKYKRIVGNLVGNLAITTMKVKSRYFHRIGVSGQGVLKMYQDLPRLPKHKVFHAGKSFPVITRHSNSLSADDDARIDARGAAIRILLDKGNEPQTLLDLTLKSGKAFYARTIEDFANWLTCGLPAREQQVKRAPHIRKAVWGSLRKTNSYTELHYYSNICRLLRFDDGREMYVKFKIRPFDYHIGEDSGQVEPKGILPPETAAIPGKTLNQCKKKFTLMRENFRSKKNTE